MNLAAMGVMSGQQDLVVAGGVESMSRTAPLSVDGFTANNAHLYEQYPLVPQGISGGPDRRRWKGSRARIATASACRASNGRRRRSTTSASAAASCRSTRTTGRSRWTMTNIHGRGTTMESLAGLNPSFAKMGVMTPANDTRSYDEIRQGRLSGRSSRWSTCTTQATRRAWSMGRVHCCLLRRSTRRRTA